MSAPFGDQGPAAASLGRAHTDSEPMPRPKATRAKFRRLPDEWEAHRDTIRHLFTVESMKVKDIAEYMRAQHNFDHKPKDYEYRFRKWNLRRNLHASELRFITHQLDTREADGKSSDVFISGKLYHIDTIKGRAARHKVTSDSMARSPPPEPPHAQSLVRVQTPPPVMSGGSAWPEGLPWIMFIRHFQRSRIPQQATVSIPDVEGHGWAVFLEMVRPFYTRGHLRTRHSSSSTVSNLNNPRKIEAVLDAVYPQVRKGDHATTAKILHNGSPNSVAVEMMPLVVYLATNNMMEELQTVTGCNIDLSKPGNMMDCLRGVGLLSKVNLESLVRMQGHTGEAFLELLLDNCIVDDKSCDILQRLIAIGAPFGVNHHIKSHRWSEHCIMSRGACLDEATENIRTVEVSLLQAVILVGNFRAVNMLLSAGAEVESIVGKGPSTLQCLASLDPTFHNVHLALEIFENVLSKMKTCWLEEITSSPSVSWPQSYGLLRLAIISGNCLLVARLLHETLPGDIIGHEEIRLAALYADSGMISSLFNAPGTNRAERLPKDVLVSVLHQPEDLIPLDRLLSTVECLLELGADPAVEDFALEEATRRLSRSRSEDNKPILEIMKVLLRYGSSTERRPASELVRDRSPLHIAIEKRSLRAVELLLDWGADIDYCFRHRNMNRWSTIQWHAQVPISPLMTALDYGFSEIAKSLLRRKLDLKLYGHEVELAMKVSHEDDVELISMLVEAGGQASDMLVGAVRNGHQHYIEFLLMEVGPDFDRPRVAEAALSTFRRNRDPSVIKFLFSNLKAVVSNDDMSPIVLLELALAANDNEAIANILARDDLEYSSRALYDAVFLSHQAGDHCIVSRLLGIRKPSPNDSLEVAAVALAAVSNDVDLLAILMRALMGGPWFTTVLNCFRCSDTDLVLIREDKPPHYTYWCLRLDGDIDLTRPWHHEFSEESHILQIAAGFDSAGADLSVYQHLVDAGVSADESDPRKVHMERWKPGQNPNPFQSWTQSTPLESVIRRGDVSTVEHLLDLGAIVNTEPKFDHCLDLQVSRNAVQLAVEFGTTTILELLLEKGADVDAPPGFRRGVTCLQLAASMGAIGTVRLLLDRGAEVNAKRSLLDGRTAIEIAAENGRMDVLGLLLHQGQNLIQNPAQRYQFIRATKFAENGDYKAVANMLRTHMGTWDATDKRRFEECDTRTAYLLDDMTQKPSEFERSNPEFFDACFEWYEDEWYECDQERFVDDMEEWIGKY